MNASRALVRRQDPLLRCPGLCGCLSSDGGQVRCISSRMNSPPGQAFGPRSPYRVARGSMDQVRFTGTRKIELGRLSEVHF